MTTQGTIVLPAYHYRVFVDYKGIPSKEELEEKWGVGNVSFIFNGRRFYQHESCLNIDTTPREKVFYLHTPENDWDVIGMAGWAKAQKSVIAPKGYRFATHEETHAVAMAFPGLMGFVGPGSYFVAARHGRYVARVWSERGQRTLGRRHLTSKMPSTHKVLLVCR